MYSGLQIMHPPPGRSQQVKLIQLRGFAPRILNYITLGNYLCFCSYTTQEDINNISIIKVLRGV